MFRYHETRVEDNLLPIVWKMDTNSHSIETICDWLTVQREAIDQVLHQHGALLIRGLDELKTSIDFERAMEVISPELMGYIGGTTPRQVMHGKIMTATEIPPAWSISLHQEMSYTKNPPSRIAFFCLQSAAEGGYSTLGDMRAITQKLDQTIVSKFKTHGVQLRRALPSAKTLAQKPGVQKSWNEVLGVDSCEEAEIIVNQLNWQSAWLDSDTLQLWQEILPATKEHPVNQEEVWFNQTHMFSPACAIAWAKRDGREKDTTDLIRTYQQRPEILDTVLYGNGESVSDEEALYLFDIFRSSEINIKLLPTDLLILDNTLVAHGRTAFSGNRRILVALVPTSGLT